LQLSETEKKRESPRTLTKIGDRGGHTKWTLGVNVSVFLVQGSMVVFAARKMSVKRELSQKKGGKQWGKKRDKIHGAPSKEKKKK